MLSYNNIVLKTPQGNWFKYRSVSPQDLPAYTMRVLLADGTVPDFGIGTWTQVSGGHGDNVWDVTYANTNWTSMFGTIPYDSSLLEVLGANMTGVTIMRSMFGNCSNLRRVSLFDTSTVTDMRSMFYGCHSLESVPLFDTSSVTNMHGMLSLCSTIVEVPLFNTSSVTDMSGMFAFCSYLTTVPLFNTSNVTDMSDMFDHCTYLTTVPLFNTSNVTDMNGMFKNCPRVNTVPLFDTSSVTDMSLMFMESALTEIPLFDTSSATNMRQMFRGCGGVISGALALYQQASTQAVVPVYYDNCFYECGIDTPASAPIHSEMAQIPASWGGLGS